MIQDYQIQEFLRQAHRVGDAGLTLCSSGNISWRIGDEALVSGTGSWVPTLPKEKVAVCRVADGEVLNGVKPSMESGFHLGVLRERPDCDVVLHFQSKYATVVSCMQAIGHNAIAGGFQGQRQWTDFYPNGDYPEALMNTSFDWNGTREPIILATENDAGNGVAMLFNHLLTGRAQIFSDVRTYWSPEAVKRVTGKELTGRAAGGIIHLINSGATTLDGSGAASDAEGNPIMKHFWEMTDEDVDACLKATTWYPANRDYFRGGGFSSNFLTRGGMPVTMVRLNHVKGLGPVLQLAEGWTVDVDPEIHKILDKRTDPTWPTTWFAPRLTGKAPFNDVYSVMNNWGANHGAITYGHVGADLITLCSMLRIPVCMHNVEEDQIFRPASWNAFGMDKEGADFRACKNYGPIYK